MIEKLEVLGRIFDQDDFGGWKEGAPAAARAELSSI